MLPTFVSPSPLSLSPIHPFRSHVSPTRHPHCPSTPACVPTSRIDPPPPSSSSPLHPPNPLPTDPVQPGHQIHHFRLHTLISRQGPIIQYTAFDLRLPPPLPSSPTLSIKLISLRALNNWTPLDALRTEARILSSLHHSAIPTFVTAFDHQTPTDTLFLLVTNHVPMLSISTLQYLHLHLTPDHIYSIFEQTFSVLHYLSTITPPLLHRHITPSSIHLTFPSHHPQPYHTPPNHHLDLIDQHDTPHVTLTSFVLAHNPLVPPSTHHLTTLSPPTDYTPPEHLSPSADERADLYSAAASLLTLLTRMSPSQLPRTSRGDIDLSSTFTSSQRHTFAPIIRLLHSVLQSNPQHRPSNAKQALSILHNDSPSITSFPSIDISSEQHISSMNDEDNIQNLNNNSTIQPRASIIPHDNLPVWKTRRVIVQTDDTGARWFRARVYADGMRGRGVERGMFAATWLAFTATWTIGVLSSGGLVGIGMSLFSAPFWRAGGQQMKIAYRELRGIFEIEFITEKNEDEEESYLNMNENIGNVILTSREDDVEDSIVKISLSDVRQAVLIEAQKDIVYVALDCKQRVVRLNAVVEPRQGRELCEDINGFLARVGE